MALIDILSSYIFSGIIGNSAYDVVKKFWGKTLNKEVEEVYIDALSQAVKDQRESLSRFGAPIDLDRQALNNVLTRDLGLRINELGLTELSAKGFEQRLAAIMQKKEVLIIGGNNLGTNEYEQLIHNLIRQAKNIFREHILVEEGTFKEVLLNEVQGDRHQLLEISDYLVNRFNLVLDVLKTLNERTQSIPIIAEKVNSQVEILGQVVKDMEVIKQSLGLDRSTTAINQDIVDSLDAYSSDSLFYIGGLCSGYPLIPSPNEYFVAHEFSEEKIGDLRRALEEGLNKTRLTPYTADQEVGPGHILCKIAAKIKTTAFSIFDLPKSQNRNVYLELGIAIGLGKPSILIKSASAKVPPLIEGLDYLGFTSYSGLQHGLSDRIQFHVGRFSAIAPQEVTKPNTYFLADGGLEQEDFREAVEKSLQPYKFVPVYLGNEQVSTKTVLSEVISSIKSTCFGIYRIDGGSSANSFLSLGIAIGLNRPWLLIARENSKIPSDVAGLSNFTFRSFSQIEQEFAERSRDFLKRHTGIIVGPSLSYNKRGLSNQAGTSISGPAITTHQDPSYRTEDMVAQPVEPRDIPHNLPPRSQFIGGKFVGRAKELQRIHRSISISHITYVSGIGGIGKTALALEAAYESLSASRDHISDSEIPIFDGYIWVTAQGGELRLNHLLEIVARTLAPDIVHQQLEDKRVSVNKLLQNKNYLIIVDNYETVSDNSVTDFLMEVPEPSRCLITGRKQSPLPATMVHVKGLVRADGISLIRNEGNRLELTAIGDAEDSVLQRLNEETGGAPLALRWLVGQIYKGLSLDRVLQALHSGKSDIFETIFARSWSLLNETAQRILMMLSVFPTSISGETIVATSTLDIEEVDEALIQLVGMSLVESTDNIGSNMRRYGIHPLTKYFASHRLTQHPDWTSKVKINSAEYFLQFALKHGGPEDWGGWNRLEQERDNIAVTLNWCHEAGEWLLESKLMQAVTFFTGVHGYWADRVDWGYRAVEAARQVDKPRLLAWILTHTLGWILLRRGEVDSAKECLEEAAGIYEQEQDYEGLVFTRRFLGRVAQEFGDIDGARVLYNQALELLTSPHYKQAADSWFVGEALGSTIKAELARIAVVQRNFDEAENLYRQGMEDALSQQDIRRYVNISIDLATLLRGQNRNAEARQLYENVLNSKEVIDRQDDVARCKFGLALIEEREGKATIALELVNEAIKTFERLGATRELISAREALKRITIVLKSSS